MKNNYNILDNKKDVKKDMALWFCTSLMTGLREDSGMLIFTFAFKPLWYQYDVASKNSCKRIESEKGK